jgi:hypothetical protein
MGSPYPPLYALVKIAQDAPVFDDARDNDVAAEAIYFNHLCAKLNPLGIHVVDVELADNPTGAILTALRFTPLAEE